LRVLLDETLPRRLLMLFGLEVQARTVGCRGWSGKQNGELLKLADEEFDVFLTTDKGIPHQQNLAKLDLAVILLRAKSNDYEDLSPLMEEVDNVLGSIPPGTLPTVSAREPS
jgi:hypothetical protein